MSSSYTAQFAQKGDISLSSGPSDGLISTMLEVTQFRQEQYNQIRRKQDQVAEVEQKRINLQSHVDEQNDLLQLPLAAASRSRSPSVTSRTSQRSHASQSTSFSVSRGIEGISLGSPTSPSPTGIKIRGRRKGPLPRDAKAKTAIKRAMKLACENCSHRKVKCICFDPLLDILEQGYQASCRSPMDKAAGSAIEKNDGSSLHEAYMFEQLQGAGEVAGGYASLGDIAQDLGEHSTPVPVDLSNHYQNLVQMMDVFHSPSMPPPSAALPSSSSDRLKGHTIPGTSRDPLAILAIGREYLPFKNCWQCEFVYPGSRLAPQASMNGCQWIGHLDQLKAHYEESHHSFDDLEVRFYSKCSVTGCGFPSPGYETPRSCISCEQSGQRWVRWYYGRTSTLSTTDTHQLNPQSDHGVI